MAYLAKRKELVGEQRIEEVRQEWQGLFKSFAELNARGVDAASDESLALARKARSLIDEFTGGDAGIERSLGNLYRNEGSEAVMQQQGMSVAPGAFEQMSQAMQALQDAS